MELIGQIHVCSPHGKYPYHLGHNVSGYKGQGSLSAIQLSMGFMCHCCFMEFTLCPLAYCSKQSNIIINPPGEHTILYKCNQTIQWAWNKIIIINNKYNNLIKMHKINKILKMVEVVF